MFSSCKTLLLSRHSTVSQKMPSLTRRLISKTVVIKGLPANITVEQLKEIVAGYGETRLVRLLPNNMRFYSSQGVIGFGHVDSALSVVDELHDTIVLGRRIRIEFSALPNLTKQMYDLRRQTKFDKHRNHNHNHSHENSHDRGARDQSSRHKKGKPVPVTTASASESESSEATPPTPRKGGAKGTIDSRNNGSSRANIATDVEDNELSESESGIEVEVEDEMVFSDGADNLDDLPIASDTDSGLEIDGIPVVPSSLSGSDGTIGGRGTASIVA